MIDQVYQNGSGTYTAIANLQRPSFADSPVDYLANATADATNYAIQKGNRVYESTTDFLSDLISGLEQTVDDLVVFAHGSKYGKKHGAKEAKGKNWYQKSGGSKRKTGKSKRRKKGK